MARWSALHPKVSGRIASHGACLGVGILAQRRGAGIYFARSLQTELLHVLVFVRRGGTLKYGFCAQLAGWSGSRGACICIGLSAQRWHIGIYFAQSLQAGLYLVMRAVSNFTIEG